MGDLIKQHENTKYNLLYYINNNKFKYLIIKVGYFAQIDFNF